MPQKPAPTGMTARLGLGGALVIAVLAGCLFWVFWPSLRLISERWVNDAEYSHGYLVPLFSAYLLWSRRGMLGADGAANGDARGRWWGLVILVAGLALRFAGTYTYFDWLDAAALIPC